MDGNRSVTVHRYVSVPPDQVWFSTPERLAEAGLAVFHKHQGFPGRRQGESFRILATDDGMAWPVSGNLSR